MSDDIQEESRLAEQEAEEKRSEVFAPRSSPAEAKWYVIHTYSGYEDQVADNLGQRIAATKTADRIFEVLVPTEKQIEVKYGKRRTVERKIFPGYVLVNMLVDEQSWYVVRNTPNVTGFIGFGTRPTPISIEEVERIKKRMGVEEPTYEIDLIKGDLVRITDGALKGFEAKVEEVDEKKGKLKLRVSMFGRETPVVLDYLQVKKI